MQRPIARLAAAAATALALALPAAQVQAQSSSDQAILNGFFGLLLSQSLSDSDRRYHDNRYYDRHSYDSRHVYRDGYDEGWRDRSEAMRRDGYGARDRYAYGYRDGYRVPQAQLYVERRYDDGKRYSDGHHGSQPRYYGGDRRYQVYRYGSGSSSGSSSGGRYGNDH